MTKTILIGVYDAEGKLVDSREIEVEERAGIVDTPITPPLTIPAGSHVVTVEKATGKPTLIKVKTATTVTVARTGFSDAD